MIKSFLHSHKIRIKHLNKGLSLLFYFIVQSSKHLFSIASHSLHSLNVSIQDHIDKISHTSYLQKLSFPFRKKAIVLAMIALPIGSGAGIGAIATSEEEPTQQPLAEISDVVDLTEEIIIIFDAPVINENYREHIIIEPKRTATARWNDDRDQLVITPKEYWEPQTNYALTLPTGTYKNGDQIIQTTFSFETAELPSVSATYPEDGQEDFYLLTNEGLQIVFNRELRDYYVNFVITPSLTLDIKASDDRTSFTLVPLEGLKENTNYTLTIYTDIHTSDNDVPQPIKQLSFSTLPQKPQEWPKDFNERLAATERFTIPQIAEGKYIDVNLEAQITTLFHDGKFIANFIDSTGTNTEPTPTGEFEIYNKDEYALSDMYQVYLPFWMAFTSDGLYGFHDLPIWPVGHEERPAGGTESLANIGRQASPGCVRHDTDDSQTLYEWSDIGTRVVIY